MQGEAHAAMEVSRGQRRVREADGNLVKLDTSDRNGQKSIVNEYM
jgi:hypothetical protein